MRKLRSLTVLFVFVVLLAIPATTQNADGGPAPVQGNCAVQYAMYVAEAETERAVCGANPTSQECSQATSDSQSAYRRYEDCVNGG